MTIVRILDFEATTAEPDGQIIEVGWCDLETKTGLVLGGGSYLCGGVGAIPPESRAVHHIRPEQLAGMPPHDRRCVFEDAWRAGATALVAHGAEFEARYIIGNLPLLCTYKAAMRAWPEAPSYKLFGLLYWLEDQRLVEFDRARAYPPHRAGPDAYATAILLGALLAHGCEGRQLVQWTAEPAMLPRCPIGNWRGRRWAEVDTGFLNWILSKPDMGADIRFCAAQELDRRDQDGE